MPDSAIPFGPPFANALALGYSGGHTGPPLRTQCRGGPACPPELPSVEALAKYITSRSRGFRVYADCLSHSLQPPARSRWYLMLGGGRIT
jgi:hypothetical protein